MSSAGLNDQVDQATGENGNQISTYTQSFKVWPDYTCHAQHMYTEAKEVLGRECLAYWRTVSLP